MKRTLSFDLWEIDSELIKDMDNNPINKYL